jgi:hypothetical protein
MGFNLRFEYNSENVIHLLNLFKLEKSVVVRSDIFNKVNSKETV